MRGPPSSNTLLAVAGRASTTAAASATSPTNTGCTLALPSPTTGTNGATNDGREAILARRLNTASSGPNTTLGRRMVAVGNPETTASSPSTLERQYRYLELSSAAPMPETWIHRSTPP